MENRVVLASSNLKKLKEIKDLLKDCAFFNLVLQKELGITAPDEPFFTFLENALFKARHAARESQLPALADDSGLCVPVLKNAPGVFSARFAGENSTDEKNNLKLLELLKEEKDRRAFFVCVFVFVQHADDPLPLVAEGLWEGEILKAPRGENGFGYDPIFLPKGFLKSAAELEAKEKNAVSHRFCAMEVLKQKLRTRFLNLPR